MKPDILELVAEDVHDAWAAEKKQQGYADHIWPVDWTEGIRHNVTCEIHRSMHHADMLPYAELSEYIKNYDRVTAQTVIDSLKKRGFFITNLDTGEYL